MENLEEDLSCSVCYSLFSDPRVLPCSHTFCKTCLDNVLQVSTNYSIWRPLRLPLKCPNCRNIVELPSTGVDALPINVSLRAIIEKYQKDSQPRPPSCLDHPRQPLNVYCVQDRQLICGMCLTVGQHQGHPIDDLQAAFIRERQAPARLLARLSEQRWAQVCALDEQLQNEKALCESLVKKDRQAVEKFFQSLELLLATKRENFMATLDAVSVEISLAYDPLIHKVKDIQEEQLDLVSLGSSVEKEDSPLVFLDKVHMFRERVDALVKAPLPSVTHLSITPRAAEFLQQHWPAVTIGRLGEGPVPQVYCCTKTDGQGPDDGPQAGGDQAGAQSKDLLLQLQPTAPVVLLGLLLLLVVVWHIPVGEASLGFSLLSQLSLVVQGLGSELTSSLWETAGVLYAEMEPVLERCGSALSTLGETIYQQLASFYKSLSSYCQTHFNTVFDH